MIKKNDKKITLKNKQKTKICFSTTFSTKKKRQPSLEKYFMLRLWILIHLFLVMTPKEDTLYFRLKTVTDIQGEDAINRSVQNTM